MGRARQDRGAIGAFGGGEQRCVRPRNEGLSTNALVLVGRGLLSLLFSQTLLLRWGLAPLQRVSLEISRIESGEQSEVQGVYPTEIAALTNNLNTLIKQERVRRIRYKETLSYLAHSLKTPLAVLRSSLGQPDQLACTVAQQVSRMDHIVQHQLGRAGASGATRFAPWLALAPAGMAYGVSVKPCCKVL